MTVHHPRRAAGAALIAAVLLLSACGASGGDDADEPTTTAATEETTTTEAEETTTSEAEVDDDAQARAEAVDLEEADFPEGWTATPAQDDGAPSPTDDCDPSFTDDSGELATFTDDDFVTGDPSADDGSVVSVETKVFESEEVASEAMAPFTDEEVLACFDEVLKANFGADGGNMVEGEFRADEYPATTADETVAASAEYMVTTEAGETVPVVIAVLIIRTGDLATQVVVQSYGGNLVATELQAPFARIEELQAA